MNKKAEVACEAVEKIWELTIKVRALCPSTTDFAIGKTGYLTADWYRVRGVDLLVNFPKPLTEKDIEDLNQMGAFINRSFVVSMAAILEDHGVVPYKAAPDLLREGAKYVQLTKRYRNHFAHGDWEYDSNDPEHQKTRKLLEELLPDAAKKGPGFVTSIDSVLEPLMEGVLTYIRAST